MYISALEYLQYACALTVIPNYAYSRVSFGHNVFTMNMWDFCRFTFQYEHSRIKSSDEPRQSLLDQQTCDTFTTLGA